MSAKRRSEPIESVHAELMRQMGSKDGYDPMPPSQHAYLLDAREPMKNRAIAWVWSVTIHPGRGFKRTPQAHDKRGDLTHVHAAKDLGWTPSNALVVFRELQAEGRIRIAENGVIWLCGDVPEPTLTAPGKRRKKGEIPKEGNMFIFLPERLRLHFQPLDKIAREREAAEYFRLQELKSRVLADSVAAGRSLGDKLEDDWYAAKGCTPEKDPRGRPKHDRSDSIVQLSLLQDVNFVHISEPKYEQKQNATSEQNENGSVQKGHPYRTETESSTTTSSSDIEVVREAMNEYGRADDDAVTQLVSRCRAKEEKATAEEIAGVVREKGDANMHAGSKRVRNPIGFLLEAVPKVFPLKRVTPPPILEPDTLSDAAYQHFRKIQEHALADPNISEAEKAKIREALDGGRAKGAGA